MMTDETMAGIKVYHMIISVIAALGAGMTMQVVGQTWTTSFKNMPLQYFQRGGLALLSAFEFASGVMLYGPIACDPGILIGAASVSSAVALIMVPTALLGHAYSVGHPS